MSIDESEILPTQDTASITLLPRPYSDVMDVEKDHPNMLYVAKDVRGITPYALTFNDVGSSMLNEGGLVLTLILLLSGIITIPLTIESFLEMSFLSIVASIFLILITFVLPIAMLRKVELC
ncbi:hypothetical protein [Psychrobacter okhotskensis]|uniref:hypothetical protein n=1 Tax=Psychrobacter okhotskensis TaxID=212403 RepID=UPI0019183CA3|nr:hypothetical protein [Psychrobacter okhotskensis]